MSEEQNVFLPYDVLVCIFKMLDYKDLTTVACVNKYWNEVSRDSWLWNKFEPKKHISITDMKLMIDYLKERGTKHLDLEMCKLPKDECYKEFAEMISAFDTLEVVKLPLCTEKVLEELFKKGHKMQFLSIGIVFHERPLNLENVSRLSELKELHLSKFPILGIINYSGLAELRNLTSLELDVYTENDCKILCQMKTLKSISLRLEVPNGCTGDLSQLSNLETLRIHFYKQPNEWTIFFQMIKKIEKLKSLELTAAVFKEQFLDELLKCKSIENLTLGMNASMNVAEAKVNTCILNATQGLNGCLKTFTWVVGTQHVFTKLPDKYIEVERNFPNSYSNGIHNYLSFGNVFERFKQQMPKVKVELYAKTQVTKNY